ncbi:MAG TPA: phage major capsid protein [Anaerohalosphaeraceae bacterium]|nr:phage major capsid protein [Anaerohalosphaeraceae bacterium]
MNEQDVKKMLEDLLLQREKGLLTNEQFIKSVSGEVNKLLADRFADIDQLRKNLNTLSEELRSYREQSMIGNPDHLSGLYKGVWGNARLAQDFGLYIMAGVLGSSTAAKILEHRGYKLEKAVSSQNNPSGGLLIPQQLVDAFVLIIAQYGAARRFCQPWLMTTDTESVPKFNKGLKVYCTEAGVIPTPQDLSGNLLTLKAQSWDVFVPVNRDTAEDVSSAMSLGNILGELMAMAFAEQEDRVLFCGDGTSPYFNNLGITGWFNQLSSPKGLVSGSGSGWNGLTLPNFRSMMGALHPYGWGGEGPRWFCSSRFYFEVMMKLADAAGGASKTEIIVGEVSTGRRFLGLPVEFVPLPYESASNQICCVLANLGRGAVFGDRRQTTIEQSREALFLQRQIAVLATERVAISVYGCHDVETDQTKKAGTIIGLKTG